MIFVPSFVNIIFEYVFFSLISNANTNINNRIKRRNIAFNKNKKVKIGHTYYNLHINRFIFRTVIDDNLIDDGI